MSLYNMMNGVNPLLFFAWPMLFDEHPETMPRVRDLWPGIEGHEDLDEMICLLTRVGGGNRNEGYGEEKYTSHPNFVKTFDAEFDSTFGWYIFSVPEQWKSDYDLVTERKFKECSEEYKQKLFTVFPKLKERLNSLFY